MGRWTPELRKQLQDNLSALINESLVKGITYGTHMEVCEALQGDKRYQIPGKSAADIRWQIVPMKLSSQIDSITQVRRSWTPELNQQIQDNLSEFIEESLKKGITYRSLKEVCVALQEDKRYQIPGKSVIEIQAKLGKIKQYNPINSITTRIDSIITRVGSFWTTQLKQEIKDNIPKFLREKSQQGITYRSLKEVCVDLQKDERYKIHGCDPEELKLQCFRMRLGSSTNIKPFFKAVKSQNPNPIQNSKKRENSSLIEPPNKQPKYYLGSLELVENFENFIREDMLPPLEWGSPPDLDLRKNKL